jgi:hypothetical protein
MWYAGNESLPMANNWSIVWLVRYQVRRGSCSAIPNAAHDCRTRAPAHAPDSGGVSLVLLNNPMNKCHSMALIHSARPNTDGHYLENARPV